MALSRLLAKFSIDARCHVWQCGSFTVRGFSARLDDHARLAIMSVATIEGPSKVHNGNFL
jgi:hypothetical protein